MIVLVYGGRDYDDADSLWSSLDGLHTHKPITRIVHGGARGADTLGGAWGHARGIDVSVYEADWGSYGRSCRPKINQRMLDEEDIDLAVECPGGKGTADMQKRVVREGIVIVYAEPQVKLEDLRPKL